MANVCIEAEIMEHRIQEFGIGKCTEDGNLLSREQGQEISRKIQEMLIVLPVGGILILDFRDVRYATATCLIEIFGILDGVRQERSKGRYIILRSESTNRDLNDCLSIAIRERNKAALWLDEKGDLGVLGELTKAQQDTLKIFTERRETTSAEASKLLNIPISAASNRLRDLYNMGLIMREERILDIGGIQFAYLLPPINMV